MTWSIGRHPPDGLCTAPDLSAAVSQTIVLSRVNGIGGARGRMLKIWRRGESPKGFVVGPCEHVGKGGIQADTLTAALELRSRADADGAWTESNRLVVWAEGSSAPVSQGESRAILRGEGE